MIKTRLTELVGIKYPIIQAGMGPYPVTSLCIAAANAGCLGLCPARPTPSSLKTSASRHTQIPPMTTLPSSRRCSPAFSKKPRNPTVSSAQT